MIFRCFGSGSKGNSYALIDEKGIVLLDAGISYKEILKGIDYRLSDVNAVLVTHRHTDHMLSSKEFEFYGIPVYGNAEIPGAEIVEEKRWYSIPSSDLVFCPIIVPHTSHDKILNQVVECPNFAFLMRYRGISTILYATDYEYLPYTFKKYEIEHLIIEVNYIDELVDLSIEHLAHKLKGHCSLKTALGIIEANKTESLKTVTAVHLSKTDCDKDIVYKAIKEVVGENVRVYIAEKGLEFEL